jgi:hypothetical protein
MLVRVTASPPSVRAGTSRGASSFLRWCPEHEGKLCGHLSRLPSDPSGGEITLRMNGKAQIQYFDALELVTQAPQNSPTDPRIDLKLIEYPPSYEQRTRCAQLEIRGVHVRSSMGLLVNPSAEWRCTLAGYAVIGAHLSVLEAHSANLGIERLKQVPDLVQAYPRLVLDQQLGDPTERPADSSVGLLHRPWSLVQESPGRAPESSGRGTS